MLRTANMACVSERIVMTELFWLYMGEAAEAGRPVLVADPAIVITPSRAEARIIRDAGGNSQGKALQTLVRVRNYVNYVPGLPGRYQMTQKGMMWCLDNIGGLDLGQIAA